MMKMRKICAGRNIMIVVLFGLRFSAVGQRISIADMGLAPNSNENAIPYLRQALDKVRNSAAAIIVFPKGVYHFIPTFAPGYSDSSYLANQIGDFKNLTIDGSGSAFIFHGKTIAFDIRNCVNIRFRGFSIDYNRPMVTQGDFALVSDTALHLRIDKGQYPYEISNQKVWYTGDGWRSDKCRYNQVFDKNTGNIIPGTHDDPCGDFYSHPAKEISPGLISFQGPFKWERRPLVSDVVTMYNYIYAANTFQFEGCRQVSLDSIDIYHGGSLAVYATATTDISINHVDIKPRKNSGRLFANMADGFHLKGCGGKIIIQNCEYNGSGDDFVNVHNMYATVEQKLSARHFVLRSFKGFHFSSGDAVWHVDHETGRQTASNRIKSMKLISGSNWKGSFDVMFEQDAPASFTKNDLLESAYWLPSVTIRNNRVLKRHRGAGIRVTTPAKVLIEKNYFNTAGHALLIEGDLDGWMESGAVKDMVIRENIFENCLTSGSTTGSRWEWGEAIIDITPSVKPFSSTCRPFHNNIIISGNKFIAFDFPVLRARAVGNLRFERNSLVRSYVQQPYTVVKSNFLLEGCRRVNISGNKFSVDFPGKNISTNFMQESDLAVDPRQCLTIDHNGERFTKKLEW